MAEVLLVEDDDQVRRSLKLLLRFEDGLDVVADTNSGAEATRYARELQPDIVLLDLGLPDLAGRDVLTAVRVAAPRARVIVFSGQEPDDTQYWAENAAAYVIKGSATDYLLQVLRAEAASAVGVDTSESSFPAEPASVPAARRFLLAQLERWDIEDRDDAALVLTELAANAVEHAQSGFHVRVSRTTAGLRIEVHDASRATPEPQPFSSTAEGGRGMILVATLASSWGIDPVEGDGKVTWAEIDLTVEPGG